jgi:hypothetical protein
MWQRTWDGKEWAGNWQSLGGIFTSAASVSVPSRYVYEIVNVKALTTRALFEDTNVGNASVTPGNWPTTTKTDVFSEDIIDGGNYQPDYKLRFGAVVVELCEHALLSYTIANKHDARTVDIIDTEFSFNKAASVVANDALQSINKQITEGVKYITSVEVAALTIPVSGTILGIIAGWLTKELGSMLQSGHCDGLVAVEQYVTTGRELYLNTLRKPYAVTTHHPGTDSNAGCGPTSAYDITWRITQLK